MTRVNFRDIETFSPTRTFRATATSPDNQEQNCGLQQNFELALYHGDNSRPCWVRKMPEKRDKPGPCGLWVSDQGTVVVQGRGMIMSAFFAVLDRSGSEVMQVELRHGKVAENQGQSLADPWFLTSTAGLSVMGDLGYFLSNDFVFLFATGRRMIIDTEQGRLLSEPHDTELAEMCAAHEVDWAIEDIELSTEGGALRVLARHHPPQAVEILQWLDRGRPPSVGQAFSHALKGWRLNLIGHRWLVGPVLRMMGIAPSGASAYTFQDPSGQLLSLPALGLDRDTVMAHLDPNLTCLEALEALGAPDKRELEFREGPQRGLGKVHESWVYFTGLGNSFGAVTLDWPPGDGSQHAQAISRMDSATSRAYILDFQRWWRSI